jgi:hypothetical protein
VPPRPPDAAFVTRLRPVPLPVQAARQLPDQSTTLWVESYSAGDTRLQGAPKRTQFRFRFMADASAVAYYATSYPSPPPLEAQRRRYVLVDNQSTHLPPCILSAFPSSSVTSMIRSEGILTCLPEIRYQVVLSPGTQIRRLTGS